MSSKLVSDGPTQSYNHAGRAAIYARYSSERQDASSIAQQIRRCREWSASNGVEAPDALVFVDEAISGADPNRPGLKQMLAAAERGEFAVLVVDSVSRIARDLDIFLRVRNELQALGIRLVVVAESLDTSNPQSRFNSVVHSLVAEQQNQATSMNVQRGLEHTVLNDYSCGDYPFGYASVPIPGTERGKDQTLRKENVIDVEHARWVRQAFEWYVLENRSINWIATELTKRGAPKRHNAVRTSWHRELVRNLLANEKYIGRWPWGKTIRGRHPVTKKVQQRPRQTPEGRQPLHLLKRPHLRIVSDDLFERAQAKLAENVQRRRQHRDRRGRLKGSTRDLQNPRHLLQGLFGCFKCGEGWVTASRGYMQCYGFKRGLCVCATRLRRDVAERVILEAVANKVLTEDSLIDHVTAASRAIYEAIFANLPSERLELERRRAELQRIIENLLRQLEDSESKSPILLDRLQQRQAERQEVERELAAVSSRADLYPQPPDEAFVERGLRSLEEAMRGAVPSSALAIRNVFGKIMLEERPDRFGAGKHVVGLVGVRYGDIARFLMGTEVIPGETEENWSFELDFEPVPKYAEIAEEVKRRFDAGETFVDIGRAINQHHMYVARAFRYWYTSRGQTPPNPRCRSPRKPRRNSIEHIASDAKALWDQGFPLMEIAFKLGRNLNVIRRAVKLACERAGIEMMDGRTRRKVLRLSR